MIVYIILFVIIMLLAVISNNNIKQQRFLFFICFILLFLFAGFRQPAISGDFNSYYSIYNSVNYWGNSILVEPSFIFISKLSHYLNTEIEGVYFIYAAISTLTLAYAISRKFINIYIVLFYYSYCFFLHPMTQIRLSAAIPFILISFNYIYEKRIWKFLFFVLIGAFFHQTSLLFIPFYFILQKKISIKIEILVVIIAIILSQLFELGNYIFIFGDKLGMHSMALQKLHMHEQTMEGGIGLRTANIYYLLAIAKISFNIYLQSRFSKKDIGILYTYMQIHFYGYLIYILFSDIHLVSARIAEMFSIGEIIFIPILLLKLFKKRYIGEYAIIGLSFFQLMISLYWIKLIKDYSVFFL